ncbi:hypothetical protein F5Y16DRAFT_381488 [Xylariaceae sp. FL0255]|nr:hypothetical protein F5Y16DRAFT_381488 [Xylariaceae sp. FL0255]
MEGRSTPYCTALAALILIGALIKSSPIEMTSTSMKNLASTQAARASVPVNHRWYFSSSPSASAASGVDFQPPLDWISLPWQAT